MYKLPGEDESSPIIVPWRGARHLSAEADRIKHDPEGVVVTLEVTVGCNENKKEQAFRARHGDQPICFATPQRRFV